MNTKKLFLAGLISFVIFPFFSLPAKAGCQCDVIDNNGGISFGIQNNAVTEEAWCVNGSDGTFYLTNCRWRSDSTSNVNQKPALPSTGGSTVKKTVSPVAKDVNLIADINPVCWKVEDCVKARKEFYEGNATQAELEAGWLKGEYPCTDQKWGKCLAGTTVKTEIKFGGQNIFKDIGDFIFVNYNYILGIVGILAVIMIIVAGIQWVTSAGNSEAIGAAKKRIGGALIGVLIAYLSFAILNTINPALVELRLPQVVMLRPITLTFNGKSCADDEYKGKKLAIVKKADGSELQAGILISVFGTKRKTPSVADFKEVKAPMCGKAYAIEGDAGSAYCLGSYPFSNPNGTWDKTSVCHLNVSPDGESLVIQAESGVRLRYVLSIRPKTKILQTAVAAVVSDFLNFDRDGQIVEGGIVFFCKDSKLPEGNIINGNNFIKIKNQFSGSFGDIMAIVKGADYAGKCVIGGGGDILMRMFQKGDIVCNQEVGTLPGITEKMLEEQMEKCDARGQGKEAYMFVLAKLYINWKTDIWKSFGCQETEVAYDCGFVLPTGQVMPISYMIPVSPIVNHKAFFKTPVVSLMIQGK